MHDLFQALGLEPRVLLVNVAGFVVLVLLLKRYAFGPIGEILDDRAREVESNLDEAERVRQRATSDRQMLDEQIEKLDERGRQVVAGARQEAERIRGEIIHRADEESRRIVEQGQADVERAAEEARRRLRAETADIAVSVSERVLRQALNERRQAGLVDAFIADLEHISAQGGAHPQAAADNGGEEA